MSDDDLRPPESDAQEDDPLHGVVTAEGVEVELPTVGRLVHFRLDFSDGDPVLRPALVLDAKPDGSLVLRVFLAPADLPVAPGTGVRWDERLGHLVESPFGPECGQWRWPLHEKSLFFLATA